MDNTTAGAAERRTIRSIISSMGNTFSLAVALIGLCVVWIIATPHFLTVNNIMNVLMFASILAIRASGLTIAMILGGLDISQNAIGAVSALLTAMASVGAGMPWWVSIIIMLAVGLGLGSVNAFLVSICKISPIITTLATMQIFRGMAWLIQPTNVMLMDPIQLSFGRGRLFGVVPYLAIIAAATLAVCHYILRFTTFGRKVYMLGGNENASYLSGINSKKVKFIAFLISGVTASLAGYLLSCQVGAALPQAGQGTEMLTIAAVILGGVSLSGGKGTMSGTILGVLILQVISNGLTLLSVNQYYQMIVSGVVLVIAVGIDIVRNELMKKQLTQKTKAK